MAIIWLLLCQTSNPEEYGWKTQLSGTGTTRQPPHPPPPKKKPPPTPPHPPKKTQRKTNKQSMKNCMHISWNILQSINSLRPSTTVWRQKSGSTLAQVMACWLTAPIHYMLQYWLTINEGRSSESKNTSLEITNFRLHPHLPGLNELKIMTTPIPEYYRSVSLYTEIPISSSKFTALFFWYTVHLTIFCNHTRALLYLNPDMYLRTFSMWCKKSSTP